MINFILNAGAKKNYSPLVTVTTEQDTQGGDINIYIDGYMVAFFSASTGNLHLLQLTNDVAQTLSLLGLTIEGNRLAIMVH